jgi:protein TonB
MLSSVGASGALHAIAVVVIVAVFGVVSPNLLPPPHGRNSVQLTASSVIVVDAVEATQAEPPQFTILSASDTELVKSDRAAQQLAAQPISPSPPATAIGLPHQSSRLGETRSDLPPLSATSTPVSKTSALRVPPSAVAMPPSIANAGQLDEIPATIHSPRPEYPAEALAAGVEGRVVLRVELDRRGEVARATVITSSGHTSLDEAAKQAVAQWRFEAATRLGIPVATAIGVPITFRIERN